jgi:DNA invertase Pin-like site-specific DNA recombinase
MNNLTVINYQLYKTLFMNGRIFGYARVSTDKQDCQSQITQLRNIYPDIIIFSEIASTRKIQTELTNILQNLSSGDTLVVCELSRLARNLSTLIGLGNDLKKREIRLVSLKEGIDTDNSLMGSLLFNLMGCFYEFERDIIRERTMKALESKRKRGLMGGRPKVNNSKIKKALADYRKGDMSINEILESYDLGRSTLYKYIKLENEESK